MATSTGIVVTLGADGTVGPLVVSGRTRIKASGDFGGGTLTLQDKNPAGDYAAVVNGAWTEAVDKVAWYPRNAATEIKLVLSGSASPDLDVWIQSEDTH